MISKFFIDRPVFASVLSIMIVLAGLVAMRVAADLAVSADRAARGRRSRRPIRAPSPRTIAATVAAPLEQQINGVETHDLHAVDLDRLGHDEPHCDLRDRHQPRPERRSTSTTACSAPCRCCRGKCSARASWCRSARLDPAGRDHVVAGRTLRHDLHQQLRAGERARRAPPHCRASAMPRCSAPPTIRCASGSGPTSSPSTI